MKLLANPIFIRMVAVFLAGVAAFVGGIVVLRILRRTMVTDDELPASASIEGDLPVQAYTVIQQLKQQKFALQNEQKLERVRSRNSEHVTAAIISNLPCGIVMVTSNGLVRKANAAARDVLGFASPLGMSMSQIFRDCKVFSESGNGRTVAEVLDSALRGQPVTEHFACRYFTPNSEERSLKFDLIRMNGASGELLGVAVVITDQSDLAELREAQLLRNEIGAEMALELRTSLSTLREWTRQMQQTRDPQQIRELAEDISAETGRLEKVLGSFLAGTPKARAAQA